MDIIAQKKIAVEGDNSDAQDYLLYSIQNMPTNTKDLVLRKSMNGPLDFSVLQDYGLSNIRRISIIQKGNVTSISNLPKNLQILECTNQLLTYISNIPETITELNLHHNQIEMLILKNLKNLKKLNLSNNHIESIEELPESIEELYLSNNAVYFLDLAEVPRLRILHVFNNQLITLKNVPSSIIDLKVEDGNPDIQISYSNMPVSKEIMPKKDFLEALDEYFSLKAEYEKKKSIMKKQAIKKAVAKGVSEKAAYKYAKKVVPKCLVCKRNVGMVFERKDTMYIARCGDMAKPCGLKIQLSNGSYQEHTDIIRILKKDIDSWKEKIIRQKMDTLFNYKDEKSALDEFNSLLETYRSDSQIYEDLVNDYENKIAAEHQRELIRAKINKLHELKRVMNASVDAYLNNENTEAIQDSIRVYVNEYSPEIHNLRLLKYPIMESNFTDVDLTQTELFQRDIGLAKIEYLEEAPIIKAFHLSAAITAPAITQLADIEDDDSKWQT
jgi:hypothetical protein